MRAIDKRVLREMADIQFVLQLAGVDKAQIRAYFQDAGLLEKFNELEASL